ncbi:hypothetical protein SAMN05421819_1767 [Bryocella elongata]|uniref:Uncharacterized protein n=1 Tax=Bryocella elongata TaxID=863522 RepID=A0A1H5WW74_9BACT|nr:hypothetical protein SAMN05421819_1767 [Bryocella elongata]
MGFFCVWNRGRIATLLALGFPPPRVPRILFTLTRFLRPRQSPFTFPSHANHRDHYPPAPPPGAHRLLQSSAEILFLRSGKCWL